LVELSEEKREPLKGDGILFGALWIRDVLAENGVDALVGDWRNEAPKLAFFGDILSGDAGPWPRFGSATELASSRKSRPRFGVSRRENWNGEASGRLAGLDIKTESPKSTDFPGGKARWPLSATALTLRLGVKLIFLTGELNPVADDPFLGVAGLGSPFSSIRLDAFLGVKLILRTGELNPVTSAPFLTGE
jgi:hypothetical protein